MSNDNYTGSLPHNKGSGREVRAEQYNWRDQWISERHRAFGWDAPMLDLDFPALEYDSGTPVALIEYKHKNAAVKLWHPSFKAMRLLADNSKIPFFIVIYSPEHFAYYVVGMNSYARQVPYCAEPRWFNERNFVRMLYFLRRKVCSDEILNKLSSAKVGANPVTLNIDGEPL